jgi:hypothetical protein
MVTNFKLPGQIKTKDSIMAKKNTNPEITAIDPSRVAFESAAERHRINVERSSHLPDRYKYEHAEQMWKFWQDAEASALSRVAQEGGEPSEDLVTRSSALKAIGHVDHSNSHGRYHDAVEMLEPVVQGEPVARIGYPVGHFESGLEAKILDMSRVRDGMKLYAAPVVQPAPYKPE